MLSVVQAHPVGFNATQWIAIAGPILTFLGTLGRWMKKRLDEQDEKKHEFENTISTRLTEQNTKLSDFENKVDSQHADLGVKVDMANMRITKVSERVARLEGPATRIEQAVKRTEEAVTNHES